MVEHGTYFLSALKYFFFHYLTFILNLIYNLQIIFEKSPE